MTPPSRLEQIRQRVYAIEKEGAEDAASTWYAFCLYAKQDIPYLLERLRLAEDALDEARRWTSPVNSDFKDSCIAYDAFCREAEGEKPT